MTSESFEHGRAGLDGRAGIGDEVTALADELRAAFQRARVATLADPLDVETFQSVRRATRAFARTCLANDATPEATLVALKRAMRAAAPDIDSQPTSVHDAERDLTAAIVAWCIEDYYRAD